VRSSNARSGVGARDDLRHFLVTVWAMFETTGGGTAAALADALMSVPTVATVWIDDAPQVSICRIDAWELTPADASAQGCETLQRVAAGVPATLCITEIVAAESA
jgi:hypothetical protein